MRIAAGVRGRAVSVTIDAPYTDRYGYSQLAPSHTDRYTSDPRPSKTNMNVHIGESGNMNEIQQTRSVLAHVQRAHGLAFSLSGRAASGLQGGAWMVADVDGRPAVLK